MFAIFEDGSHQYRVKAGDIIRVDFRSELEKGAALKFDRVLAAGSDTASVIGRPLVDGASVETEIVNAEFKAEKIEGGKFKRRKGYYRHWGHTQRYTEVVVKAINVPNFG
jgi:large subunit ribosomal protein L21